MDNANFDAALATFLAAAQNLINENYKQYPNLTPPKLEVMDGVKNVRVVKVETFGAGRSVYCFIEKSTGNILKADGWKRPAKGPRGNIYAENPVAGCTPYGAAYAR